MQSRLESFLEALINVFIGFWINFVGNLLILPAVGFTTLTIHDNFIIGFWFTIISVARTYIIRRWAQRYLTAFKIKAAARIRALVAG